MTSEIKEQVAKRGKAVQKVTVAGFRAQVRVDRIMKHIGQRNDLIDCLGDQMWWLRPGQFINYAFSMDVKEKSRKIDAATTIGYPRH